MPMMYAAAYAMKGTTGISLNLLFHATQKRVLVGSELDNYYFPEKLKMDIQNPKFN